MFFCIACTFLSQFGELRAQLTRRSEERILDRLFRGAERFSDGAQPQSLFVLQLENHPLAGRKRFQRAVNAVPDLVAQQTLLWIGGSVGLLVEEITCGDVVA